MYKFITVAVCAVIMTSAVSFAVEGSLPSKISDKTKACLGCHREQNSGIYQQWGDSRHFTANVGCYECHRAEKGDPDVLRDDAHAEFVIATIVSPRDCGRCHPNETDEFVNSHHSKAGRIMGSLDNLLAEVVEGNTGFKTGAFPLGISAAASSGCWQCHGGEVKILRKTGKLDPATWPNSGIGRINPDGSEGSCAACHQRHAFSAAQARQPENCGKCHMGPDHPQKEIYEESKHGISYRANREKMNLNSSKWVVGEDYSAAPTCATCHMSATKEQPVTHNVGLRIKWNNRPEHSTLSHETDAKWKLTSAGIKSDQRRKNMQDVCVSCHQPGFTDNFFTQYESVIDLYEKKFAAPGEKLYNLAVDILKTDPSYAKFSEPIDFTWFELWHHEGRRARHAASMQGPDYTHWHGTYEIARNWYVKYVPELREIIGRFRDRPAAREKAALLEKTLSRILNEPDHRWFLNKEDPAAREQRKKSRDEFIQRYK